MSTIIHTGGTTAAKTAAADPAKEKATEVMNTAAQLGSQLQQLLPLLPKEKAILLYPFPVFIKQLTTELKQELTGIL